MVGRKSRDREETYGVAGSGTVGLVIQVTPDHLTLGGQKKSFSGVAFEFRYNLESKSCHFDHIPEENQQLCQALELWTKCKANIYVLRGKDGCQ